MRQEFNTMLYSQHLSVEGQLVSALFPSGSIKTDFHIILKFSALISSFASRQHFVGNFFPFAFLKYMLSYEFMGQIYAYIYMLLSAPKKRSTVNLMSCQGLRHYNNTMCYMKQMFTASCVDRVQRLLSLQGSLHKALLKPEKVFQETFFLVEN